MSEKPETNCPFYGCAMYFTNVGPTLGIMLIASRGNQCGLVRDRHAPCQLEIEGLPVEWRDCPRVAEIRPALHGSAPGEVAP